MKNFKEENNQEETSQIQTYHTSFQIKKILKRRFGITPRSLSLQQIKKFKALIWEVNSPETRINKETLKILLKQIKFSKTTRKLNLLNSSHYDLTDLWFFHFGHYLRNLNTIQDLIIAFYYDHSISSDKGLYYLCKGLKRLRVLKKLHIELGRCHSVWHAYTFAIFGGALKRLNSLEVLQLKVDLQYEIWWLKPPSKEEKERMVNPLFEKPNEGVNEILKYLKNCHFLRSLWLSFFGYNFKEGCESFCRALKKLISLQKVGIEFRRCLVTDNELLCLSESLGKLVYVKFISLAFENCDKISDDAGISRAKELIKGLKPEAEIIVVSQNV